MGSDWWPINDPYLFRGSSVIQWSSCLLAYGTHCTHQSHTGAIATNQPPLLPSTSQVHLIKGSENAPPLRTLATPRANLLHYLLGTVFLARILKEKEVPLLTMMSRPHWLLCPESRLEAALLLNENRAAVMVTLFVNLVASQPQIKRK